MSLRRLASSCPVLLLLTASCLPAATLYVDPASATPAAPFATPGTAAHTIQEAIDAATDGDVVLVAPGTYSTGSTLIDGQATRVVINKALSVESQQGAAVTTIQGAGPVGPAAVRGVYVGANAVLRGFTIAGGATNTTGDLLLQRSGGGIRAETSSVIRDCIVSGCRSSHGGGGVVGGTLVDCAISSCFASTLGGGAWQATLQRCLLHSNNGTNGGGAHTCTLSDCLLRNNFSSSGGGGAHSSTLTNCTVTANSASATGGGVKDCTSFNSIVFANTPAGAAANYVGGTFDHCCTTPLPPAGTGNLALDPLLQPTNGYRLALASPCRDAGDSALAVSPTDLYGNARIAQGAVDLGAHELNLTVTTTAEAGPGSLRVVLSDLVSSPESPTVVFTSALAGQTIALSSAIVLAPVSGLVLDATALASPPVLTAAAGTRVFQLTGGALTLRGLRLTGTTVPNPGGGGLYQSGGGTATVEDCQFTGFTTTRSGGAIFSEGYGNLTVTRSTFMHNRAAATNDGSTGGGAIAAYSVGTLTVSDCLFEGNSAEATGGPPNGGLWAGFGGGVATAGGNFSITRCTFRGNTGDLGGGLSRVGIIVEGTVTNCTFEGNIGTRYGGAYSHIRSSVVLTRCTFQGNSSAQGGAIDNNAGTMTLTHCTVAGNAANFYGGLASTQGGQLTLAYCVLAGNTPNDVWNIGTSTLVGVNLVENGLFEPASGGTGSRFSAPARLGPLGSYGGPTKTMPLAADSPAREAGVGSPSLSDQRGYPIVGVPDLGAYEGGTYSDFVVWIYEKLPAAATLAQHEAAFDFDGDGQSNFEEWLALTDPNRAGSRFTASVALEAGAPTISFPSASGRLYRLQQSDTLLGWSDAPIAPLAGDGNVRSFVLPEPGVPKRFFRVSAERP